MAQRCFRRQIAQVQNLELPPSHGRDTYQVTKFAVEEWSATGAVCVTRTYRDPKWHDDFGCHESYQVGPRGAVKRIYSSMY
jgi:hypothetical protein